MNKEEIKQKDKENKAIKFYTNYIKAQEQEIDWMYRQDEEYYRDEIEQKELLIKGFKTILNLIEKQENIIDKMAEKINQAYFDKENMYIWFEEKILPKDEFGLCEYKDLGTRKTCIKEYFKKEVEKDVKD